MNLAASRVNLVHRCTIERNEAANDDWSNPDIPQWVAIAEDVPCRAWTDAGREQVSPDRTAVVVDRRVLVPLGTDVTERDRIASVTNRGNVLLDGSMGIEAVLTRPGHLEIVLRRTR